MKRVLKPQWNIVIACLLVILPIVLFAFYVESYLSSKTRRTFDSDSQVVAQQFIGRIKDYENVLYSGRAFITNSGGEISQDAWIQYFYSQQIIAKNSGVSSVSYVKVINNSEKKQFENKLSQDNFFKYGFKGIYPAGTRENYAVANLLASNNNVQSTYGFDLYSSAIRKQVLLKSVELNMPVASPPTKLASGYMGFFISLPITRDFKTDGYVIVALRTEDLISSIYKNEFDLLAGKIEDITDSSKVVPLYSTKNWNDTPDGLVKTTRAIIGNRMWLITIKTSGTYGDYSLNTYVPTIILISSLVTMLAITTIGISYRRRHHF